jgi:hypothetical protein
MGLTLLSRAEIDAMGPPIPEELADLGISKAFLVDLALKHLANLLEPTIASVAESLHLPRSLTEELLYQLYREKLLEMRIENAVGATRYTMLDHGWDRVMWLRSQCAYEGPAPVPLIPHPEQLCKRYLPT